VAHAGVDHGDAVEGVVSVERVGVQLAVVLQRREVEAGGVLRALIRAE
jgi:hypothetical protein